MEICLLSYILNIVQYKLKNPIFLLIILSFMGCKNKTELAMERGIQYYEWEKIRKVNNLISDHEEKIANKLLDFIETKKEIKLIGKTKIHNKNRAPTISFTVDGMTSKSVSEKLISSGIALRNDNFYAWRCLKALGIDTNDGVIRASMVHYNDIDDVKKLISALKKINK